MTRTTGILLAALFTLAVHAQGDQQVRAKADGLFEEKNYVEALPLYSQLVSLAPSDRMLNYRFGTCLLFGGTDRDKAIGHLKFATQDPSIPPDAWYWLGRAYHLNYQFKDAQTAYQRYQGTGSRKELEGFPIAALDKQCRNGQNLLSNLKEITVHNKVEVDDTEFFRFYELGDIGGKIVVLPEELKSSLDKRSKQRTLVYLPEKGGAIYFASYGKDGRTGRDIYRTELLTNGTFATPVKLAGYVNTDQDEDFAFMHPDGKNFYFSSKGHNSMGGYDVFRSAYDKVSETFGPAENLDFAVNTPDDDLFYMTDGANKQACFASGRDSEQGKLHVYRVATAQVPLVVSVMKGTYASALDKDDRKAHITVEDAVTHERVADVRTDINGSYVLSLPRSGRFRYLVECGPGGRTHSGTVDVPRSTTARAYRQELELVPKGDLEELVIRNYFDEPLEEDMIALMMEEIKRRARLDITPNAPPSVAEEPRQTAPDGDVMTQAGFAGDMNEAKAVQLARDDAREQEQLAKALDQDSKAAFAFAIDAAATADRLAREATRIAEEASAITDEVQRDLRMKEAATIRQRSREANLRARAAHRAGQDIDAERMAVQQRATTAGKLATDLGTAVDTKQQQATLAHLRTLKQRLDTKVGPEGDLALSERVRRALTEHEKEAARSMNMATSKRAEESEFADQIERVKRERDGTKSKARKEELSRSITEQEQQLAYLHAEVDGAFNKARELELGTAVMRGQHALIQHLSTRTDESFAPPTKEEVTNLGQRIAGNDARIAAIPVDERFDGTVAEPVNTMEARAFNWQLVDANAVLASNNGRTDTRTMDGDPTLAQPRTVAVPTQDAAGVELRNAEVPFVPVVAAEDLANAGGAIGEVNAGSTEEGNAPRSTGVVQRGAEAGAAGSDGGLDQDERDQRIAEDQPGRPATESNAAAVQVDQGVAGVTRPVEVPTAGAERSAANESPTPASTVTEDPLASTESSVEPKEVTPVSAVPTDDPQVMQASAPTAEMNTFLLQNEKAELEQAIAAERNSTRREGLRKELAALETRINEASVPEQASTDADQENDLVPEGVDMERIPVTFYPDTKEADIITLVYPGYAADKQRIESLPDLTQRTEGLSGLELMLADSLRGEMVRQAAVLELAPQQGEVVLPKIERLRVLRQAHVREAERLSEQAEVLAMTGRPDEREGRARSNEPMNYPVGQDPVADRFIFLTEDPEEVYTSKVEHRSSMVQEAVASKEADLARMQLLDQRIDSLEAGLVDLPRKEFDKQRRIADKLIDERMIIRTDLGQRSAYLTKEEWRTATDSLKQIDKQVNALGLAPDENLVLMAERMKASAKTRFAEAEAIRKKADRTEDIIQRDSLFRTAYTNELKALAEMDKAITVKTYLLGPAFRRGESLSYDDVARRVLGITETSPLLAERSPGAQQAEPAAGVAPVELVTKEAELEAAAAEVDGRAGSQGVAATAEVVPPSTVVDADGGAVETGEGARAADLDRARQEALELAARTEKGLPTSARAPAHLYENFLSGESVMLKPEALDPAMDPVLIAVRAETAGRESAELEQRSLLLADKAAALDDSAATARKRDRERLAAMAVRSRLEADSLHNASLQMAEEARSLEIQRRDAEQAKQLRDRLVKYYYLSGEEQLMVVQNPDMSRFFQAKAKALEQLDAAAEAETSARANRELSEVLRQEIGTLKVEETAGRITREEAAVKREVLYARAEMLSVRADSLSTVAARLRGAANVNDGQAGVMLQSQAADRSTEWMALEMRTRRGEPQRASASLVPAGDRPLASSTGAPSGIRNVPVVPPAQAAGTDELVGNATPVRTIAPPFGTDSRSATTDRPRPVVEIAGAPGAYQFPALLETDLFELRPATDRAAGPIAMDARMPGGIIFKVQIGAFRTEIDETTFADMTPVMGEHTENGLVRYTAGLFTGFQQAAAAKDKVRDRGYRDAFVVAYRDGVRIPLGVAMRETRGTTAAPPATADRTTNTSADERAAGNGVVPRAGGNTVLEPARTTAQEPAPSLIQRPITTAGTTPTETAALTTEQILAKYPATAEAIVEAFVPDAAAATYYNVPGAAPAVQVETIKGLFYTVQVGVYSKPVPLDRLFNITPLNSERTETAKVRYTTGRYPDIDQARGRKDQAVASGVKDAFITAYLNGKRIPMQEAAALLQQFGPAILAKP